MREDAIKGREVLAHDVEGFAELCIEMHKECEPDVTLDLNTLYKNLVHYANDIERKHVNMWVVSRGADFIGGGVGFISPFMFSTETKATLLYWFVKPEYRKTRAAFEVLHNFENWAALQFVSRIELGVAKIDTLGADDLNKMFRKRGFQKFGEVYYREPNLRIK